MGKEETVETQQPEVNESVVEGMNDELFWQVLDEIVAEEELQPGEFTVKMAAERYGLDHEKMYKILEKQVMEGVLKKEQRGRENAYSYVEVPDQEQPV
jgi:hypothetical protein